MDKLEFIYKRRSVRNFTEQPVQREDLEAILTAATYGPIGKNVENRHFVVVQDKEKIQEIADAIELKVRELAARTKSEEIKKQLINILPYYVSNLTNAPVAILAYCGPYPSHTEALLEEGAISQEEAEVFSQFAPGVQNISAAMENLLLAAAALGYGGCWMTGPMYAAEEISKVVGFEKEGYFLATMTPLGVPSRDGKNPPRKPLTDVVTFI
jgi:Nitroreductase